mgnify:CR=1 FL=1
MPAVRKFNVFRIGMFRLPQLIVQAPRAGHSHHRVVFAVVNAEGSIIQIGGILQLPGATEGDSRRKGIRWHLVYKVTGGVAAHGYTGKIDPLRINIVILHQLIDQVL